MKKFFSMARGGSIKINGEIKHDTVRNEKLINYFLLAYIYFIYVY